jgi:hypothetical protein
MGTLQSILFRSMRPLLACLQKGPVKRPSALERELIENFRENIRNCAAPKTDGLFEIGDLWATHLQRLRELAMKEDPRRFLRWDVILQTMFADAPYMLNELRYLKKRPDWHHRWKEAVREDSFGYPRQFVFYPRSSGNLIHHAYHWATFEEKTKTNIHDIDFIFEFGGGYGSLCRLLKNKLSYKGKYLIYDLPEYSILQELYLKALGMPLVSFDDFEADSSITCISDFDQLAKVLRSATPNSLFVGTWSISETPVAFRNLVLALVSSFSYFLVAYADTFLGINNIAFFREWRRNVSQDIIWSDWQIAHLPGNRYFMGARTINGGPLAAPAGAR